MKNKDIKQNCIIIILISLMIIVLFTFAFYVIDKVPSHEKEHSHILEITNKEENIKKISILNKIKHMEIEANLLSQDIPVFMYHSVTDDLSYTEYMINAVPTENFKKQIKAIKDGNFDTIFVTEIEEAYKYNKPVVLTFDDGFKDFYYNVYPILKENNLKATLFMIIGFIDAKYYCSAEQLKEMQESGHVKVESHTTTHKLLDSIKEETIIEETLGSKNKLYEKTKIKSEALCYPVGKYNDKSLFYTKENYKYGISMTEGLYNTKKYSRYEIPRFSVHRYVPLNTFIHNLNKTKKYYKY